MAAARSRRFTSTSFKPSQEAVSSSSSRSSCPTRTTSTPGSAKAPPHQEGPRLSDRSSGPLRRQVPSRRKAARSSRAPVSARGHRSRSGSGSPRVARSVPGSTPGCRTGTTGHCPRSSGAGWPRDEGRRPGPTLRPRPRPVSVVGETFDERPGLGHLYPWVVGQVGRSGDTHRAGGFRGGAPIAPSPIQPGRLEMLGGDDPLAQVVHPSEVGAVGGGHPAPHKQGFQSDFPLRPTPHRCAISLTGVVEVGSLQRPPVTNLLQYLVQILGCSSSHLLDTGPIEGRVHPPSPQVVILDRDQRCLVAPVLQHLTRAPQPGVEGVRS